MCGNVRYEVKGDSEASVRIPFHFTCRNLIVCQILCHCTDCRKIGGSTYSSNALYSADGFKVTQGTPKQHKKKADGGNEIISNFWYVPYHARLSMLADM
jgi:hypothetical protein